MLTGATPLPDQLRATLALDVTKASHSVDLRDAPSVKPRGPNADPEAVPRRAITAVGRPPRLVLRFSILVAAATVLAAAAVLLFTSSYAISRAEDSARFHTKFVADSILSDRLQASDFSGPVAPGRLARLDALFRNEVLGRDYLRVKLYSPDGIVTYSNQHALIGTTPDGEEVSEALRNLSVSDVTHLNAEGGSGRNLKVLETYVPVKIGGRAVGVFELYQDYGPVVSTARSMFLPIAGVLAFMLAALYAALVPLLHGTTKRLRRQMEEIEHQALHDSLTGLPNRARFRDHVEHALRDEDAQLAVMLIDLDRFKEVNDTLGHESGDLLLQQVGRRLSETLREADIVARLGGDEFAVLARDVSDHEMALQVANRLRRMLETPFSLRGLRLEVEASVGIALAPEHGRQVDPLLRHADVAMYLSKQSHVGAEVYSRERDEYSPDRLRLVGELRSAISRGELELHYQPKVSLSAGESAEVEALVRWAHPKLGQLPPDRFIPLAEHTGLIRPLTRHVLDKALRQVHVWNIQGYDIGVAVNLSSRDLMDLRLPDEVEELVKRWQVDPTRLELEITEGTIISDPLRTKTILVRLKELGVRIAVDDFGMGYSSLGYLRRLPLDVLKIDKSFVSNMLDDEDDAAIVRSTIDLAHNLGLEVVAEGVETEETRAALVHLHCDRAQGYLFSPPIQPGSIPRWLADARGTEETKPVEAA
jgi:diguanylate cyclase (GGDEF)-like protein